MIINLRFAALYPDKKDNQLPTLRLELLPYLIFYSIDYKQEVKPLGPLLMGKENVRQP